MTDHPVVRRSGVMSGQPCLRGTRVPVAVLFENLADGLSLAEIVDSYPTLEADDCRRAILLAGELLAAAAPVDGD